MGVDRFSCRKLPERRSALDTTDIGGKRLGRYGGGFITTGSRS